MGVKEMSHKSMKYWAGKLLALVFVLLVVRAAKAQLPTATILGVVKDATGAVVPGANLTAKNTETGATRTSLTAADGSYRFSALPVGNYEVRAEQSGFQAAVRTGITIAVSQEAVVNITLEVGAITQTVAVTAEAPLVNTTSGALGGIVSETQVAELPLNGRDYDTLTLLQPGVTLHEMAGTANATMRGVFFSANGAIPRSNLFLMDGAPMGGAFTGTSASVGNNTLGIEGLREWKVVTNFVDAEYGGRIGAEVVMVSKGGTNSFHGSAYEYLRNSNLDARNFFDYTDVNSPGTRLPPYRRNQFGGSAGGPIKKDKAFFFVTYEELLERQGLTIVDNTIGAGCHGPAGATITSTACPQLGATGSVKIAPVIAPFLALYPVPNLGNNGFTQPATLRTNEGYGQIRGDFNLSGKDAAFVRFTADRTSQFQPLDFPELFQNNLNSGLTLLTLSDTHTFSPAQVGTFRFSFSRNVGLFLPGPIPSGPQYGFTSVGSMGSINVGGLTNFGAQAVVPNDARVNLFSYSGDFFYTKGRHSLKYGAILSHQQLFTNSAYGPSRGTIVFSSVSSFLSGQTSSETWTNIIKPDRTYHWNNLGFYIQDDFRVRSNFTLNLGLRYEPQTEVHESFNSIYSLIHIATDPAYVNKNTVYQNSSLHNFGPRFGFAWDVMGNGKTAVRGGFGIMYDVGNVNYILIAPKDRIPPLILPLAVTTPSALSIPLALPPGFNPVLSPSDIDYSLQQTHSLTYNLTVERQLPANFALSVTYAGSRGLNLVGQHDANPTAASTLSNGQLFWSGTSPRANPNFGVVTLYSGFGNSWYNSMQLVVTKRLSKGWELNSAYTFQKSIDQNPALASGDQGGSKGPSLNILIPNTYDQGLSNWSAAHEWHLSGIYHFGGHPSSHGAAAALLNGWWTSGILTAQSGLPLTVYLSGVRSQDGEAAGVDRPNLVSGRSGSNIVSGTTAGCTGVNAGQKVGTPNLYYDPCAFSIQAIGTLGNEGRNTIPAPGVFNLDYSLVKDTALHFLGESGKLQFRAEIFNILNRANFSRPSGNAVFAGTANVQAPLGNAGQITTTDTKSRQIQFALKVIF
jgi:hypothetical protein